MGAARESLPLVAFANRLPVSHTRHGWRASSGGLVTALAPALEARGGAWVGWDGGAADVPERVEGLGVQLRPVRLARREADQYYHGFANRTLWPLLHGLVEQPTYDRDWWHAYVRANEAFAAADAGGEGIRWVHDYHLLVLPALLRRRGVPGPIAFFLHVPFPPPEVFARLPWRSQVVDGLLGADVVSFHTAQYRDNFLRTCSRLRDDVHVDRTGIRLDSGRHVAVAAHPISIDAADFAERARRPAVERRLHELRRQFAGRRVLIGVDRLDYTKGIIERLRAIELLLGLRRELRGQIAFVQVAVPSRGEIREYRELRSTVEELVGRINGRFTAPGLDVPVHYLYRGVTPDRLLAYYRLADVCLVTPLHDGMNLVAKEFVTVQGTTGGSGVLVLSEFTGAAAELREALPCNPYDLEGLAGTIQLALELDAGDASRRLERMAARVTKHDVHRWAELELGAALGA